MTLKIDGWPWKTIGHLSYAASSFVHHDHFIAIGKFKLELRVRKRSIRVKICDFLSRVILTIDGWPWKTIGHLFYSMSNFVHQFKSIGEGKLELQSGNAQFASKLVFFFVVRDLEIWWMTLNKANLRDLIAATGLVISNRIQIVNFSARVTVKLDGWPRKTIGHFFYTMSSFVHHFKSIGEFKLDLQSRNAQLGSKLVIGYPMWPWNLMDDLGKQ